MSLLDAVIAAGEIPATDRPQHEKKRYAEILSQKLAAETAASLRSIGFPGVKPLLDGPSERPFQGGLGPKKVDVSYADERNGLMLAVSIKSITTAPYGKNLKNRFYDLCSEGITLHLRFPYSVICALFCFPVAAEENVTAGRSASTFEQARKLLASVSGRQEYTDPGEKFENITMMSFQPIAADATHAPSVKLIDCLTREVIDEAAYFESLRQLFNRRNPHAAIGDESID